MRYFITIYMTFLLTVISFSQSRVTPPANILHRSKPYVLKHERFKTHQNEIIPEKFPSNFTVEEEIVGLTWYDLQSQGSISTRIVNYEDQTKGIIFTRGMEPMNFLDRGTGYNYFNGTEWHALPDSSIESQKCGWPAYQQWGENGEIVVAHLAGVSDDGLLINKRENRFQGDWEESLFQGPEGYETLLYPHLATAGTDHTTIHLLAQLGNFIMPYWGIMNPPLYSRSIDGGVTWQEQNTLLNGIATGPYAEFSLDQFSLIAKDNCVAILFGDFWNDMVLFKSIDGGETWEPTIIWEHPYPNINIVPTPTDSFYCVDGSHHLCFDDNDNVHVVFGISRAYSDGATLSWFPAVDGVGYWNESRPVFSNNINALNPYGHPDSELEENYSLIGWSQDINNNGTLDILDDWGLYYLGFSSMPQICFSEFYGLVVIYSSVTEVYDNGLQNYRHLWARASINEGNNWGPFYDLNGGLVGVFDENVFPSVAQQVDESIHIVFQHDNEPGMAVSGDLDPYGENRINYMNIPFYVGVKETPYQDSFIEVRNMPNPFTGKTHIFCELKEVASLSLEICDISGIRVYTFKKGQVGPGTHCFEIDGNKLNQGFYFYTVRAGNKKVSGKMIKR
ncbi:MAG: T9SS type A sorting domain-containing protein [Bacteroidales bacterium]|nr:T9SS type A sorting domain-containing protein [Bacteroidales bacterium]MCF8403323.1 T9SS type A sorting domain-containing protein [Bacteroidales bacterium]